MQRFWERFFRTATAFAAYGVAAAVVWVPIAVERSIEATSFKDRVGTVPVQVSLAHDGRSTLDTGVLGSLYWEQTGAFGFGARVRVTGTPEAGGTLASYASPAFVRANAAFVSDPEQVARAYGDKLRSEFQRHLVRQELGAFFVGGIVLALAFHGRRRVPSTWSRRRTAAVGAAVLVISAAASCATAAWLFARWDGNAEAGPTYAMPGVPRLSFSSPQALEIARQVEPFLAKNNQRLADRTRAYLATAEATTTRELAARAADLAPRDGEVVILAEADPQGSQVGTRVRTALYAELVEALGPDAIALRTISGDLTSNGTVAEVAFVEDEMAASGDIPTVVVKGDHDTETTLDQLDATDAVNPDRDLVEVGGLQVVAGNDPAFKTLFGGLVVNDSGVSEEEVGEQIRSYVDNERPEAAVVLFHQPRSAAGYLGLGSLNDILPDDGGVPDLTTPRDDGIPDLPPGIINIGHLHDAAAPKVIWNTDGDEVTWTVVNQLGTSGGVEESPTFNRFSTPFSVPLKPVSIQLQYVDAATGLQRGYASIDLATDGTATISDRADIGIPPS